jgi:hypothetical protein
MPTVSPLVDARHEEAAPKARPWPSGPAPAAPRAEGPRRLTFGGAAAEYAAVHLSADSLTTGT